MNLSIILGHPRPGSLNHALAAAAVAAGRADGHAVRFHDLQAEGFDPVLPAGEEPRGAPLPPLVALHCRELAEADGIVVVHPNWWGMPPAIVAGWIDRVLRPEVAYRFLEGDAGEGVPQGLLRARTALVVNTSNTVAAREEQVFGDPLERIWRDCVLGLCGVKTMVRRTYRVVATSTALERERWIADVGGLVRELFPCGR